MSTWTKDIAEALLRLGAPSPLSDIYRMVKELRDEQGHIWHATSDATVRATLQRSSSDSTTYEVHREDLFCNTDIGKGIWSLRLAAKNKMLFKLWLDTKGNSANNYTSGITTVSRHFQTLGVDVNLYGVTDVSDLKMLKAKYFSYPEAIEKNKQGHHMFSNAFEHYIGFLGQNQIEDVPLFTDFERTEIEFPLKHDIEGDIRERKVLSYTRNRQVVLDSKQRDSYTCVPCGFYYDKKIVEAHHLVPLFQSQITTVSLDNLITLCPNCHRLAHVLWKLDTAYEQREILVSKLKEEYLKTRLMN